MTDRPRRRRLKAGPPRLVHRRDLHLLALVAGLALAALIAAILYNLGVLTMRRLPMILAVAAMAILLSSCAGFTPLGPQGPGDNTPSILGNLQGCYRQYQGSISAGLGAGASGSFNIICDPKVTPALDPAPVLLPPT